MDEDEEEIVRPKSVVMTTSVDSSKEMTAAELFTPKEEVHRYVLDNSIYDNIY